MYLKAQLSHPVAAAKQAITSPQLHSPPQHLCLFCLQLRPQCTNVCLNFKFIYCPSKKKRKRLSDVKQFNLSSGAGGKVGKSQHDGSEEGGLLGVKRAFLQFTVFLWLDGRFPPSSAQHPVAHNTP